MSSLKKLIMMMNQGSDSSSLPSHLERAEYLEATGTQWLDLGVLGYNHKVEVVFHPKSKTSFAALLGRIETNANFTLAVQNVNAAHSFGKATLSKNIYQDKKTKYSISKNGIGVDDVIYPWTTQPVDFTTSQGVIFLATLQASTNTYVNNALGKVYGLSIYLSDTLIHDYIPCFNTENRRPCMYDTITGIELYNQGTGEFNYHIEGKAIPYLAFEALEDDLQVSITKSATQYSLDRVNWVDLPAEEMTPPIAKGERVWFRAEITPDNTSTGIGTFSCTKQCNLEGTPMSLLYGDRAGDVLSLPSKNYCFAYLFAYNDKIIRVNNPIEFLPAILLYNYCYQYMFFKNTSLENSCYLPCLYISSSGVYQDMYNYCYSLCEAYDFPEFKTSVTSSSTCTRMFSRCVKLKKQPKLPMTNINTTDTFRYCSSLETSQDVLYNGGQYMYSECSDLVSAPDIERVYSGSWSILSMFNKCYKLKKAPSVIRVKTLYAQCLESTFNSCYDLEIAPTIIIEDHTPKPYALRGMFLDCFNLKYIKLITTLAPDTDTQFMYMWVSNVAPKGTIVLNKNIEWNPEDYRGVNGIPEGWEVKYCDPDNLDDIRDYREVD